MREKIITSGFRRIARGPIFPLLVVVSLVLSSGLAHGVGEKDPYSATLVEFEGEVFIQKQGEEIWLPPEVDIPLEQGDKIRTGKDARAEILMDDGSMVKLEEESELTIKALSADYQKKSISASLFLFFGRMLSNVAKFTSRKSRFDVHTPTLVAGVRGTEFIVETTDSEQTDVGVFDGKVAVGGLDKEGKLVEKSEVLLTKGFQTRVRKGKRPLVPFGLRKKMLAQKKMLDILRKNAAENRRRLPDIMKRRIKAREKAIKKWEKIRLEKQDRHLQQEDLKKGPATLPKKESLERQQEQDIEKRKKRYEQKIRQEKRNQKAKDSDKKGNRK